MEKELVNLGYMNGWAGDKGKENYAIVLNCREAGHTRESHSDHVRCISTCTCRECGYTYKIDSGD